MASVAGGSAQMAEQQQRQQAIGFQELQQIKQRFESDMNVLTDSIQKLQMIQQHFLASQENSKQMEKMPEGSDCLVPLCDGLLVRGKALDVKTNLVDIGAGYFVEMTQEKSRDYCKRRVDFLNIQLQTLQRMGQEKLQQRQYIMDAMQRQMAQVNLQNLPKGAGAR